MIRRLQILLTTGVGFANPEAQSQFIHSSRVQAYSDFLQINQDSIKDEPSLTIQLALNQMDNLSIKIKATELIKHQESWTMKIMPKYTLLSQRETNEQNTAHNAWSNSQLVSVRRLPPNIRLTASAFESARKDIAVENMLAAHGRFDGSIIIALAGSNAELYTLVGRGGSPIR